MSLHGDLTGGFAQQHQERRLRAWHRHERMTVVMELATAFHHSARAERGGRARAAPRLTRNRSPASGDAAGSAAGSRAAGSSAMTASMAAPSVSSSNKAWRSRKWKKRRRRCRRRRRRAEIGEDDGRLPLFSLITRGRGARCPGEGGGQVQEEEEKRRKKLLKATCCFGDIFLWPLFLQLVFCVWVSSEDFATLGFFWETASRHSSLSALLDSTVAT